MRWFDWFVLLGISVYVLGNIALIPFHGDEATHLYMGRDFFYLSEQGGLRRVKFSQHPELVSADAATEQHLRLMNGTLAKYVYGWIARSAGYTVDSLNGQWDWGADFRYNAATGRVPHPNLLFRCRLFSSLCVLMAMFAVYGMVRAIAGRFAGYLAAVYLAVNPIVLLHCRRAELEGLLMLFEVLVAVACLYSMRRGSALSFLILGVLSGLAVSTKHTALVIVSLCWVALALVLVGRYFTSKSFVGRPWLKVALASIAAAAVFYALNPAWWGQDPIAMSKRVFSLRSQLLALQSESGLRRYQGWSERLRGSFENLFTAKPVYYEVNDWAKAPGVNESLVAYEEHLLRGTKQGFGAPCCVIIALLTALGAAALAFLRSLSRGQKLLVYSWASAGLILCLATPLNWQRYYIPACPPIALFAALGAATCARALFAALGRPRAERQVD